MGVDKLIEYMMHIDKQRVSLLSSIVELIELKGEAEMPAKLKLAMIMYLSKYSKLYLTDETLDTAIKTKLDDRVSKLLIEFEKEYGVSVESVTQMVDDDVARSLDRNRRIKEADSILSTIDFNLN